MRLIDADKVKELIHGSLSVDTDADKEYVCGLIDGIPDGWVSVNNKLPEASGKYLIVTKWQYKKFIRYDIQTAGFIQNHQPCVTGFYSEDTEDHEGDWIENVIYWMPLPELPKDCTLRDNCPLFHMKDGKCLSMEKRCASVNDKVCKGLRSAYERGKHYRMALPEAPQDGDA